MKLEHLECLLAIVNTGSLNKAARITYCSQPALSRMLRSLEAEIGYSILQRTPNGIVPTEKGRRVIAEAQIICNYINGWKSEAAQDDIVTVACPFNLLPFSFFDALYRLTNDYENLRVKVFTDHNTFEASGSSNAQIKLMVLAGAADRQDPALEEFARKNHLRIHPLYEDVFVVLAGKNSKYGKQDSITIQELQQANLLLGGDEPYQCPYAYMFQNSVKNSHVFIGDRSKELQAVMNSDALILHPSRSAESIELVKYNLIRTIPIADDVLPVHYICLAPEPGRLTPNQRIVLNTIVRLLAPLPEDA